MDATKLVVDQDVFVMNWDESIFANGKVVKVSSDGVEVKVEYVEEIWQFNADGKETEHWEGRNEIDSKMPFEERKAVLIQAERNRELLHKKYPDWCIMPPNEPLPPIFEGPYWWRRK